MELILQEASTTKLIKQILHDDLYGELQHNYVWGVPSHYKYVLVLKENST